MEKKHSQKSLNTPRKSPKSPRRRSSVTKKDNDQEPSGFMGFMKKTVPWLFNIMGKDQDKPEQNIQKNVEQKQNI